VIAAHVYLPALPKGIEGFGRLFQSPPWATLAMPYRNQLIAAWPLDAATGCHWTYLLLSESMIDAVQLREILHYDPDTGIFRWRRGQWRKAGKIAGSNKRRYRHINIGYRWYLAHRLAWLYMTGKWPRHEIDHIDRDGFNNRLANLRDVTRSENMRNTRRKSKGGVIFVPARARWWARINVGGHRRHVGYFETEEEARAALATILQPNPRNTG
jgi:hypothetical protein